MKIDTMPVFGRLPNNHIAGTTVIIVDVLRATTSIVWAVRSGARMVIPAVDPGEASAFVSRLGISDYVLGGERGGIMLPGYDVGNSPEDYNEAKVAGKTVIMSTTNGTAAITGMSAAKNILIGAMINRKAVAKRAVELGDDVLIVCAGTEGRVTAEDICGAGAIASAIGQLTDGRANATDMTMLSCMIYQDWLDGRADLSVSSHYKKLMELGFEKDAEFCFNQDITGVVPVYMNGVITE